jgi:hypothetical protein
MPTTNAESASQGRFALGPGQWCVEGNRLELDLSDRAIDFLNALLRDTGDSPQELITKALGLYRLSLDAWKEGKAVGSAPSADALDTEFVNV